MIFHNFPQLLLSYLRTVTPTIPFVADYFPDKEISNALVIFQDAVTDESSFQLAQSKHQVTLHLMKSVTAINSSFINSLHADFVQLVEACKAWQPEADFAVQQVNLLSVYFNSNLAAKRYATAKLRISFTLRQRDLET